MHDRPNELINADTHTALAKSLFNRSWTLLDMGSRTPEQNDELISTAHASYWHWLQVGTPLNMERAHWLLARCCAAVGKGPEALHHAEACLASCEVHDHGAFDLAFAFESRARALLILGRTNDAIDNLDRAALEGAAIASDEDRDWLTENLQSLHTEAAK
jgi:hypothetical protein